MIALEVSVNGKRRYVAGHIDAGILNVHVQTVRLNPETPPGISLNCHVAVRVGGGQLGIGGGQLDTLVYPADRLSAGDEVTVRVVEVDSADPPSKQKNQMMSGATTSARRR